MSRKSDKKRKQRQYRQRHAKRRLENRKGKHQPHHDVGSHVQRKGHDMSKFISHIDRNTFERFKFRSHIPEAQWSFRIADSIADADPVRVDACLLAICEFLSGCEEYGYRDGYITLEIPPDTGLLGQCFVKFDIASHTSTLLSIITAKQIIYLRPSS